MNILIIALIVVVVLLVAALASQVFLNIGRKAELEKIKSETYPKADYYENKGTSGVLVPTTKFTAFDATNVEREATKIRHSSTLGATLPTTATPTPAKTHVEYPKVLLAQKIYEDKTPGTIIGEVYSRITMETTFKHRDEHGMVKSLKEPMTMAEFRKLQERVAAVAEDPFAGKDWEDLE